MSTDAKPCEAVLGRVCVIIRELLELPIARFSRATQLADYFDNLDWHEFKLSIEDEFDVDTDVACADDWKTVGDVCDWLEQGR
jgi:acyl carrier protein